MKVSEKCEISKLIIKYAVEKYPQLFASCSFGKDSRVIIDLAMQVEPNLQFIGIDTGYEFPETLSFAEQLVKDLKMNFKWVKPSEADKKKIDDDYGDSFIKNDKYKCCAMKVPAIKPVLVEYDAWISGLRRDETKHRQDIKIIEAGEIVKINPIAFCTKQDVWQYIHEHKLNYHPLYDQGYSSLGCQPCTKRDSEGKSERAGRFSGTTGEECGLHTM